MVVSSGQRSRGERPMSSEWGHSVVWISCGVAGRDIQDDQAESPAGLAPTFPSEIKTVQAAIAFVKSLEPKTRAKLHWKLAASALAALDTGPIREGTYDRANKAMRRALASERWLAD